MKKFIIFILLIILIPLVISKINTNLMEHKKYGSYNNKYVRVKRVNKNRIDKILLEEYVIGVVAGEMPASFNKEALKAQAVTSRTYVIKRLELKNSDYDILDSTSNQVYLDKEDLKGKWNNEYEKNINKIKNAVNETKGEVILYDNEVIDAMFFSTSNGYTENSEDVFGSKKPYLKSVISNWDKEESPVFSSNKMRL